MERTTVELTDLTTGYKLRNGGEKIISPHISASLFSGELTSLLGANGSGKTTLLRTLSGFISPLSGRVTVDGKDLASISRREMAQTIGVVLTDKVTLDNMKAEDLVGLGRSPYTGFWGHLDPADRKQVHEAMDLTGVLPLKDRMIATLSDGERQKVMIAKALAQNTKVIYLDEPSAFLDYPSKVEIMQLLRRLAAEQGKIIFQSTHDLDLALQLSDRIWLLDRNLGFTSGVPEDVALSGRLAPYFARPGIAFDAESCTFRPSLDGGHEVLIEGTGSRASMAARALCRNGYAVVHTPSPHTLHKIRVSDNGFYLDGKYIDNIEDMIKYCRNADEQRHKYSSKDTATEKNCVTLQS